MIVPEGYEPLERATGFEALLQTGQIPYVPEIANPKTLSADVMNPLLNLGRIYTKSTLFTAVAFTQFPESTFKRTGGRTDIKRLIYLSGNSFFGPRFSDSLVINPEIHNIDKVGSYHIERCGSVGYGGLSMVVRRPYSMSLSGCVWKPAHGKMYDFRTVVRGLPAAVFHHEIAHLDGRDITSQPEDLVDFSDLTHPAWNNKGRAQRMLLKIIKKRQDFWLVQRSGKFIIVNSAGDYVKDFGR